MTVVEREPEWDEQTRGRALRLTEYEDDRCTCGCGQSMSQAHDPNGVWVVDKFTCYAGRAMDKVAREENKKAEEAKWADGWDDGMHRFVREPTEKELAKQPRTQVGAQGGI